MKTRTIILLLIALIVMAAHVTGWAGDDDSKLRVKKRVAVLNFEDKTERSWRWWNNKSVGEGVSDMIVTELVKSGKYQVLERQEIDKLLQEQKLGASGIVTAESAAELGQMLGVELAVIGAVTEFGYKKSDVGGKFKRFGLGVESQSAVVAIDCRMVNTTTGEIISAENVRKEKTSRGLKIDTDKLDFKDEKDFDESLIGKAGREAVQEVVKLINKNAPKIPWQAKVVTVRDGMVYINAGAVAGIKAGDEFVIYRKGEALVDPDTGLELGSVDTKIGTIKVVNANVGQGKAAQCSIVSGSDFQRGDLVRLK